MSSPLVSIIIPSYNAEQWLTESIDSALNQTYPNIEVIVVDDGSTDSSREILQRYGDRIRVEYRPHLGGNAARNHGFSVSKGEFIQYLDADDYILPEKIERQAHFLQECGADAVYEECRAQHHEEDGRVWLGRINSLLNIDLVEHHLAGSVFQPNAMLWRRKCIENGGGWDESLEAVQDVDFVLAMALSGTRFQYHPGCHYIYRRYGSVTVSTSNPERVLKAKYTVYQKWRTYLINSGMITEQYHQALARWHFDIARSYFLIDRSRYHLLIKELQTFAPAFVPSQSLVYKSAWKIGGYEFADHVAAFLRPIRVRLSQG